MGCNGIQLKWCQEILFTFLLSVCLLQHVNCDYRLDDSSGLGRRFDGIGGISGGGATSRLLVDYDTQYQQQILDYLFLPNFGASLHIFKVEIGGDAQSTDGTESSHMHSQSDENYQRGYEWYLMKEVKKRNPNIKLYGLPWGWPGWIGNGTMNPFENPKVTVDYTMKWIAGARKYHNLTIDYIGIWNEKAYSIDYIKELRKSLDENGFQNVEIVAADGKFEIVSDVLKDKDLADAISILGFHYPGTITTEDCWKTNKTLWSSEDYSTFNDNVGAGCWARILNQNYVNGNMTSTISWNVIASYYDNLPYFRDGLMTAIEPWSGHYVVESPIWITAHTTQFTQPGWTYLQHGSGVGHLDGGGSYVSLTDGQDLTIIIETMSHKHSECIRPPLAPYKVVNQTAQFTLEGSFAKVTKLYVWYSKLGFSGADSTLFVQKPSFVVMGGSFKVNLGIDEVYTLTTKKIGRKGSYPASPPSASFPVPFFDHFESYNLYSEAFGFADQAGVFEIRDSGDSSHGKVMQQVTTEPPVRWCNEAALPITYIGNQSWSEVVFSIDASVGSSSGGALIAARVVNGGCRTHNTGGLFFFIYANGSFSVTSNILQLDSLASGQASVSPNKWFNVRLNITASSASGEIDGQTVFLLKSIPAIVPSNGFIAVGAADFSSRSPMMFDNFILTSASPLISKLGVTDT